MPPGQIVTDSMGNMYRVVSEPHAPVSQMCYHAPIFGGTSGGGPLLGGGLNGGLPQGTIVMAAPPWETSPRAT